MADEPPRSAPSREQFDAAFQVYEVRAEGDRLLYFGDPLVPRDTLMRRVWPLFRRQGYEVTLSTRTGEHVLVAEPVSVGVDGIPWTNVILLLATILSTLWAGTMWYHIRPAEIMANPLVMLEAWPFALAVLGVLGTHELGHYVMSRYHGVQATLPYFIPMPTLIGTMGAVIKMKGQMPDREALFDIGVAGPLAGLVATVVVTAVGLTLDPVQVPDWVFQQSNVEVEFGYPPLLQFIAWAVGEQLTYADPELSVNPVVIGGWVGMFVTFLNLLPVGQLDGGHIVRAMVGEAQETVAAAVPMVLFALAGYLFYVREVGDAVGIWVFWGLFAMFFAYVGPATPIADDALDNKRKLVGLVTFVLGLACFTPVPIQIIS
jgi:membrane-associated protease RseP (regulator of RpoE activity)